MANQILWGGRTSEQQLLTTQLNSLGNDTASSLGAEYDNTSAKLQLADFQVSLASLTPTAGGSISLFLAVALDGTNYVDAKKEAAHAFIGAIMLDTATAAKRGAVCGIPIPPAKFKLFAVNNAGVALGASGNVVSMWAYTPEVQ